jgi:hypothetical protein
MRTYLISIRNKKKKAVEREICALFGLVSVASFLREHVGSFLKNSDLLKKP